MTENIIKKKGETEKLTVWDQYLAKKKEKKDKKREERLKKSGKLPNTDVKDAKKKTKKDESEVQCANSCFKKLKRRFMVLNQLKFSHDHTFNHCAGPVHSINHLNSLGSMHATPAVLMINRHSVECSLWFNQLGSLVVRAFAPCLGGLDSIPGRVKPKISN